MGAIAVPSAEKNGEGGTRPCGEMAQSAGDGSPCAVDEEAQQADGEVAQAGQHLRAVTTAHLGAVFIERHIAHPMQAVLDAPVTAIEFQQATGGSGGGVQVRQAISLLETFAPGLGAEDPALDQKGLADMREVQVAVEGGRGADRARLDAAVGLIEGGVPRGG